MNMESRVAKLEQRTEAELDSLIEREIERIGHDAAQEVIDEVRREFELAGRAQNELAN
jgi:LPS O-antigen subunit length determinant protein (WzzB/FepE family)